jgi:hypothetical protein
MSCGNGSIKDDRTDTLAMFLSIYGMLPAGFNIKAETTWF